MKKIHVCLVSILVMQLAYADSSNAQIATFSLKQAPANVTIDGSLAEWGDSLTYLNTETRINYTIANDKDNLYLVLKTNDQAEQAEILANGITLSIDTKGKKKSTYTVTYPVQEQESEGFSPGTTAQEKKLEVSLTKLKRLKADGFKDVEFDLITLENTYGFKAAINYDTHGFMIYEEAVPLALFHADNLKKSEWAFNIKINGHQKAAKANTGDNENSSMGRGGRGGRGGGGGGRGGGGGGRGGHNQSFNNNENNTDDASAKPVDFWGKFILAKTL